MERLRSPIITVAGHVDHGKTSILDKIRETNIQEKEAGNITQKISFTRIDAPLLQQRSGTVLAKFNIPLEIPGLLFIDTPGHAAFTNLRKRGGSLADIAILVIDINDGIKPQTAEVLQILKANKTPFIIALNKIDNISGWQTSKSLNSYESIQNQAIRVKEDFEEKYYTLIGSLNSYDLNPELYFKIKDFTKNIAIVPCSARTGEGINEILAMIIALSQKYLTKQISVSKTGKGVILEVKKDKSINYLECILYDGTLTDKDEIAIASFDKTITSRIRNIQEALPLNRGYQTVNKIKAASGIKLQLTTKEDILPGMPFQIINNNLEEIEKQFKKEVSHEIENNSTGVLIKADSLGSLEALIVLLKEKNIKIIKAGIGSITKKDIYFANSLPEEDKAIIGFNIGLSEDIEDLEEIKKIKIITNEVVYKLIDDFQEWKLNKQKEIERRKLSVLPTICEFTILDFVFRNSNPAVFGVKVEGGNLKKDLNFINSENEKIGHIKEIQYEKKSVQEATINQEVAVSMPGVNFERQLKIGEKLYTNLSETQFREFKQNKDLLTNDEKQVLQKIAQVKRKTQETWGI